MPRRRDEEPEKETPQIDAATARRPHRIGDKIDCSGCGCAAWMWAVPVGRRMMLHLCRSCAAELKVALE